MRHVPTTSGFVLQLFVIEITIAAGKETEAGHILGGENGTIR